MKSLKIIFAVVTSLFLCIQMNAQQRRPDLEKQYKEQIKELKNNLKGEMEIKSIEIHEEIPGQNFLVVTQKSNLFRYFYDLSLVPLFKYGEMHYGYHESDSFEVVSLENGKEYIKIQKGDYVQYATRDARVLLTKPYKNIDLVEVGPGQYVFNCWSYNKGDLSSPYQGIKESTYDYAVFDVTGKHLTGNNCRFVEGNGETLESVRRKINLQIVKACNYAEEHSLNIGNKEIKIWSSSTPAHCKSFNAKDNIHNIAWINSLGSISHIDYCISGNSLISKSDKFSLNEPLLPFGYSIGYVNSLSIAEHRENDGLHKDLLIDKGQWLCPGVKDMNGNSLSEPIIGLTLLKYSYPEHAFYYVCENKEHGDRMGAVFVRDTLLNVPPLFRSVRYVLKEDGSWMPIVKTKELSQWEEYIPGKVYNVTYADKGEQLLSQGEYFEAVEYYLEKSQKNWSTLSNYELKIASLSIFEALSVEIEDIKDKTICYLSGIDPATRPAWEVSRIRGIFYISKAEASDVLNAYISTCDKNDDKNLAQTLATNINELYDTYEELKSPYTRSRLEFEHQKSVQRTAITQAETEAKLQELQNVTQKICQQQNNDLAVAILNELGNMFLQMGKAKASASAPGLPGATTMIINGEVVYVYPCDGSSDASSSSSSGSGEKRDYEKEIRDRYEAKCMGCNGTGKCRHCNGTGKVYVTDHYIKCGTCHGTGVCPSCPGTGVIHGVFH